MKFAHVVFLVFIFTLERGIGQSSRCRDTIDSYSCYHWLINGMCTDPGYRNLMIETCQKTCNLCPVLPVGRLTNCRDNRKKCLTWRNRNHCMEHSKYYDFMRSNCRRSCLFCDDVKCIDKKKRCEIYQSSGYCPVEHQYHKFMKKNCAKSCLFCSPVKEKENAVQARIKEYVKEYPCDFEINECDWSNQQFEDTADWLIGVDDYGPTTGFNNSAKYIYLDTKYEEYHALLWLPWELILPDNEKNKGKMCFHFWYQMDDGKIIVSLKANPNLSNKYSDPIVKFSTKGKATSWRHVKVNVPVSDRYQLFLKGIKGHPESYLAIDNIFFTSGQCY